MGTFFEESASRLIPDQGGKYTHWFGGAPTRRGLVPPGGDHAVNLLYDLDLRDPRLGLASRFPGLERLPLLNALQYNCCAIAYRVVSDDAVEILSAADNDRLPKWDENFPFDRYPATFSRVPIVAEPLSPEIRGLLDRTIDEIGDDHGDLLSDAEHERLRSEGYPFAQVGGRHFMWQGIPEWPCPTVDCRVANEFPTNEGKEVFAVVWERPIPGLAGAGPPPYRQAVPPATA